MEKGTLSKKMKKLKHVKIYNILYAMIQEGVYPPGSQLPSEPELALKMKVSRMTLRKSLALLNEDNLVVNIRGKGNFISSNCIENESLSMENTVHPVYNCFSDSLDTLEFEFRIEPATDAINHVLKRKTSVAVIADRWYKKQGRALSYTLSFIPIEVITDKRIDLNNQTHLENYLESKVYKGNICSSFVISHTTTGNFTSNKYKLSQQDNFVLIQETIFEKDEVVVFNKHYIPIDLFKMKISTTKNKVNS